MVSNAFLVKAAQQVMVKMGGGHSEAVYQCALVSLLMASGIPCMTEVSIPYFLNGICVGMGRADILLKSHLIELKANQKNVQNVEAAKVQLSKYLRAMHEQGAAPRTGMLILFNTPCEGPLHKRLSVIHLSHYAAFRQGIPLKVKDAPLFAKSNNHGASARRQSNRRSFYHQKNKKN